MTGNSPNSSTATQPTALVLPELQPWVWPWLRHFQQEAIAFVIGRGDGFLEHDCGAGKSISSIIWAIAAPGPILVTTRSTARGQFAGEVRRVTTCEPYVVLPRSAQTGANRHHEPIDSYLARVARPIVIMGWDSLHDDELYDKLMHYKGHDGQGWKSWIVDESHRVKSRNRVKRHEGGLAWIDAEGREVAPGSEGSTATQLPLPEGCRRDRNDPNVYWEPLQTIAARAARLSRKFKRRLGTTATLIPDRVRDLWSQFDIVIPGSVDKSYWNWAKQFCAATEGDYGWTDTGVSRSDELRAFLQWRVHHVGPERLHAELPPARRVLTYLRPEDQNVESKELKRMVKNAAREAGGGTGLEDNERAEGLLEALTIAASAKKSNYVVGKVLECLASKQKVIVFCGRRVDVWALRDAVVKGVEKAKLAEAKVWGADGSIDAEERGAIVRDYMALAESACIVATGASLGESLNLQRSDRLIIQLLPWNWGALRQQEGRVKRLGQDRPVIIEYVIAVGTIDERIAARVLEKLEATEAVLGSDGVKDVREVLQGGSDEEIIDGLLDEFE